MKVLIIADEGRVQELAVVNDDGAAAALRAAKPLADALGFHAYVRTADTVADLLASLKGDIEMAADEAARDGGCVGEAYGPLACFTKK